MTITKLTYRCDRESLGGVSEAAFAEAFENELMFFCDNRDAVIEVEFGNFKSGLHSVRGFDVFKDQVSELSDLSDRVRDAAERAWIACLENAE